MGLLPGTYGVVELGAAVVVPGGPTLDLSGLNFAICMAEETTELPQRFTTWGMVAQSSCIYQSNSAKNAIIIGRNGNLYTLDPGVFDDNGTPITISIQTGPIPAPQQYVDISALKRIHEVSWQTTTVPPTNGYDLKVTLWDVDDIDNQVVRYVNQTDTRVLITGIGLKCRQFKMRIDTTLTSNYDMHGLGLTFQVLHRPYTQQSR